MSQAHLWSGLEQPLESSQALGGVMNGYIPHRPRRGVCVVRSSTVSLWPQVAHALGFTVVLAVSPSVEYGFVLERACPGLLSSPNDTNLAEAQVVFGDWASMGTDDIAYWENITLPHVVCLDQQAELVVPPHWLLYRHTFSHAEVGGVTNGNFELGILIHEDHAITYDDPGSLPQFPVQIPACLENVLISTVSAQQYEVVGGLDVLTAELAPGTPPSYIGRLLNPKGLAPSQKLGSVTVIVPCVFCKSGYGKRKLVLAEVAGAWDVPIGVQEAFVKHGEGGEEMLEEMCRGHPGKVMHFGTDYLLSVYCRGGLGNVEGRARSPTTENPKLSLIREAARVAAAQKAPERALQMVVKQEGQKADDADVPYHLWDAWWLSGREEANLTTLEGWVGRPTEQMPDSGITRWRWGLQQLRNLWFIREWRRRVTRSFCVFARKYNRCGEPKASGGSLVWWSASESGWVWSTRGRQIYRSTWESQRATTILADIMESGKEAIDRATKASWWDWEGGSSLFFWRWPDSHFRWAREGQPHFLTGELPRFTEAQRKPATPKIHALVRRKVNKVRQRLYISPGNVRSLTHMFDVDKPPDDIRMVYDGTVSGINKALDSPHFSLPVVANTLRSLLPEYHGADLDVAEMFLNWWLGVALREYSGVDITHVQTQPASEREEWEVGRDRPWERWVRNFMGLKDSPYRSLQLMIKAKFIAYGDREDESNPFKWHVVVLNLPGDKDYDPSLPWPWVMKVRRDGHLACEVYIYVDDGRFTGWSKLECWRAVRKFSSVLSWLGIQDAYRKRTEPLTTPGPWAGTVTSTKGEVVATVSGQKWAKTREVIREMATMMEEDAEAMPRKRLEQIRGFLIYVGRTYRWMNPYLKGLHLTIDSWRKDRDEHGYRTGPKTAWEVEVARRTAAEAIGDGSEVDWRAFEEPREGDDEPPATVSAVGRLPEDIHHLGELTSGEEPAVQKCRARYALAAAYLMGDASGKGFGSGIWDHKGVAYRAGSWKQSYSDESSNFREAENLTRRIEEMGKAGELDNKELFVFTDNATYEGTFYKGYSKSSRKLTAIIFRLRKVERETGCILHVIHIAGTRMKFAGVDGLSRGDCMEGMMAGGKQPWDYVPLNEDADKRTGGRVTAWVNQWWHGLDGKPWCQPDEREGQVWESSKLVKLEPTDWFRLHEIPGHRLWVPPPAAMTAVMECFTEDHLVNPHLAHVFVIPRFMTHLWRKHLFKDADLKFYVQAGAPFWPRSMHEPLTVVVVLPLAHVENYRGPWKINGAPGADAFAKQLDTEFQRPSGCGRREFLNLDEPMPCKGSFPPCGAAYCGGCYRAYADDMYQFPVQRSVEEEEEDEERGFEVDEEGQDRFMHARDGDHVMGVEFQCDVCNFRNMNQRDVVWQSQRDLKTLAYIRRASLDVFWSRESDTVEGNARRMRLDWASAQEELAFGGIFPTMGNPKMEDKNGMGVGLVTLNASKRAGKYAPNLQFDTTRKTGTWFMHAYTAITSEEDGTLFAADDKTMFASTSPTRSKWFQRFLLGVKRRMGVIRKQDEALSSEQVLAILESGEYAWEATKDPQERREIAEIMAFVVVGFGASLRGEELPLISIKGLLAFWAETQPKGFVMIPLRGKFKGEDNIRWHLVPIVDTTRSGIRVRRWVHRLLDDRMRRDGVREGPLFVNAHGRAARLSDYNGRFHMFVAVAMARHPKAFSKKIEAEDFNLRRSMRRGSTTQATNNKVPAPTIELVNRWRKKEAARGAEAGLAMRQVYTQVLSAVDTTLRYSQSL